MIWDSMGSYRHIFKPTMCAFLCVIVLIYLSQEFHNSVCLDMVEGLYTGWQV
jgi:hypothetical protein